MLGGDGIEKPLDQIRDIDELRRGLIHIDGMGVEACSDRIEESLRNHCYFRGDYMQLLRSVPVGLRNKLEDVAKIRTLQKDIVQHKVQNFTSLLSRAAPRAQLDALRPDDMAEFAYSENMFLAGEYNNRVVAQKLDGIRQIEWDLRKHAALQKKIVQESLISGEAFEVFSIKQNPWRGNVIEPRLANRAQVVVDPACRDLATFADARWIRVQTEMSAPELYERWGLKERDYIGGNQDNEKSYVDNVSMIRRFWSTLDGEDATMQREMPVYPVKAFFWNPGVPDLIRFDGDIQEINENPQKRDKRPRLFIMVNDWAIPYGFEEHHRGPDLYGFYPVVAHCHDPLSDRAAGTSLVSSQVGTQDFVNILYNSIAKNVKANAHTQWMAERGAVRGKNFSMRSNVMITVEHDAISRNRIQKIEPGDIGTPVYNLMQSEIAYSRTLAGDPQGLLEGIAPSSVKSGVHAQTLLETANTLMAQYARMLDIGHLNAVWVESLMMQKHTDFNNPFYVNRLGLDEFPNIDIAMADLEFDVKIETKSNLPSTAITGELNWYLILTREGMMPPASFMKASEMTHLVSDEWMRKMELLEQQLVPGLPLMEQVAMLQQGVALQQQLEGELDNIIGAAAGAVEGEGAGGEMVEQQGGGMGAAPFV